MGATAFPVLVAQWLRIRLPVPRSRVQSLVPDDSACHRATAALAPKSPSLSSRGLERHLLSLEPVLCDKRSCRNEKPQRCKDRPCSPT